MIKVENHVACSGWSNLSCHIFRAACFILGKTSPGQSASSLDMHCSMPGMLDDAPQQLNPPGWSVGAYVMVRYKLLVHWTGDHAASNRIAGLASCINATALLPDLEGWWFFVGVAIWTVVCFIGHRFWWEMSKIPKITVWYCLYFAPLQQN